MKCILSSIALWVWLASCVQAGVVFEIETRDHDHSPPTTELTQIHAQGKRIKMRVAGKSAHREQDEMIYLGDRQAMVVVDHVRKSFMVMDHQTMQSLLTHLQQQADQTTGLLQDALRNMPQQQRALLEANSKHPPADRGQPESAPVVRSTGRRAHVYGYPCTLLEVTQDGRMVRHVWVTSWENIDGANELVQSFGHMGEFFQQLTKALSQQSAAPMHDNAFATIRDLGGFPVASREYRLDGTVESESALRSTSKVRMDATSFLPPAGYNRQQMFGGEQSTIPAAASNSSRSSRH